MLTCFRANFDLVQVLVVADYILGDSNEKSLQILFLQTFFRYHHNHNFINYFFRCSYVLMSLSPMSIPL